ncbi:unnamed protein product [Sphenostylis stenocarpa]|uniref:Uncharacterized protein n=1 Tax=Sphenostylis stenocarpa TaxID=92480 RepID=A0AA86SEV0_9FABA|nr:unnamed protein product [Sphenostylis stenocarpa]
MVPTYAEGTQNEGRSSAEVPTAELPTIRTHTRRTRHPAKSCGRSNYDRLRFGAYFNDDLLFVPRGAFLNGSCYGFSLLNHLKVDKKIDLHVERKNYPE